MDLMCVVLGYFVHLVQCLVSEDVGFLIYEPTWINVCVFFVRLIEHVFYFTECEASAHSIFSWLETRVETTLGVFFQCFEM